MVLLRPRPQGQMAEQVRATAQRSNVILVLHLKGTQKTESVRVKSTSQWRN